MFFCPVLNNVGSHMKGKLKRLNSVLMCMRYKTQQHQFLSVFLKGRKQMLRDLFVIYIVN
jgi:hypothetical protein